LEIQEIRALSYRACIWYPEIRNIIPTAESLILPINSIDELFNHLNLNLGKYPFVRLCTMSCKDINELPIYDCPEQVVNDLLKSVRTRDIIDEPFCDDCNGKHLFLRKIKKYDWEARCFWSKDKLRAVSLPFCYDPNDKQDILNFFEKYKNDIPYHSATIDIGKCNDIIEIHEDIIQLL